MATVIDSLLVKLGIDSSEFNAGKGKVDDSLKKTGAEADKTGAKLKKSGKDGADGFKELSKAATQFLAIIGGTMAIKSFIQDQIEANSALDRFSKNLGVGVETISAWSQAAELAGGSASGLQGTMDMLSKAQTDLMLTGESALLPYFSALGVSLADANGKAKPVNEVLLELSSTFERMDRTTANNMGRMMGIDQGTMNLLLKGRQEVELMIKRQREYGAVTKQQAEEASKLKRVMVEGRQSFEAFGRELLSQATPALEKLFSVFADMGAWMRENKEFVGIFLKIIAVGLTAIALAVTPINLIIVAVAALAAGIALLYQDYQVWKRGGESFIDWGKWEPGFTMAGDAIKWLIGLIGDLISWMISASLSFIDGFGEFISFFVDGWKLAFKFVGDGVKWLKDIVGGYFNWQLNVVSSFASEFGKKMEAGYTSAGNGVRWLRDLLNDLVYRAIAAADVLSAVFDRDWERVKFAAGEFMNGNGQEYGKSNMYEGLPPPPTTAPATVATGAAPSGGPERQRFVAAAAAQLGVPPAVVDAHLRSETGTTGRSTIGNYNYGNIKAGKSWAGGVSSRNVLEYNTDGSPRMDNAAFRSYQTPEEAAADYARLIGNRYPGAKGAKDATEYATALKKGGYATDPNYVTKIAAVARGIPGAANPARNAGASVSRGPKVTQPSFAQGVQGGGSTVSIGEIKVYTQATDADGMARDVGRSMNNLFVAQSNAGVM